MSAFIDAHRARLGVEPICRELEVSASAYRARRARPPSSRSLRDVWLLAQIRRVHEGSNGVYGQLKVWDELNDEGTVAGFARSDWGQNPPGSGPGRLKADAAMLPPTQPGATADSLRPRPLCS